MSLALNPYFLKVTADRVRVYHPQISFAPTNGPKVFTIVPVGRMKIKVFDNLVSALCMPSGITKQIIETSTLSPANKQHAGNAPPDA